MANKQPFFFLKHKWHYLLIALLACCIYWPLLTGTFSLKNDAYIYFLPWRYHISESIQGGHFPFWNPYLYTGLPLYSDIQSGTWNPIVLLISFFTRYNMQVLQWELLFYIILGGLGIYKLIRETGYSKGTALLLSVCYISSGFIVSNGSFIPWIICAAFLPFSFVYFIRLLNSDSGFLTASKFALSLFFLLVAGYPSFLIYACYIFLAAYICFAINKKKQKSILLNSTKWLTIAIVLFFLLSSPALISFFDFLPYYKRGSGATIEQALSDPFSPFCSISYLLPSATTKSHQWINNTDISMRNAYIGIFALAFAILSFTKKLSGLRIFILIATIFSFLFSLGDATPLRKICYDFLPLMDSFRHPATIRLFTTIGLLILAAPSIDSYLSAPYYFAPKIRKILIFIGLLIIALALVFTINGFSTDIFSTKNKSIKQIIDSLEFADIVILQSVIQVAFIICAIIFVEKRKIFSGIIISNMILFAWMALPFTFFSRASTKQINSYISSFPKGYPKPSLQQSTEDNIDKSSKMSNEWDLYFFYNKKITIQDHIITPTIPTNYHQYLSDSVLRKKLSGQPFAFYTRNDSTYTTEAFIELVRFTPSAFQFKVTASHAGNLNIFQQYHHNWEAKINNKKTSINKANIAFMNVEIPAGNSLVDFSFKTPKIFILSIIIVYILFTITVLFIFYKYFKPAV